MKTKALFLIIFLWGMGTLPLFLMADANPVIKDIEYLTGDDFVQVYFKLDQMIPIPDVFYPDKNDNTRIVMRMNGVSFGSQKNRFNFESSVIDFIKVTPRASNADIDVDIQLKEQVNYRVFTNQKGLYIEFPRLKRPPTQSSPALSTLTSLDSTSKTSMKSSPPTTPQKSPDESNIISQTAADTNSDTDMGIKPTMDMSISKESSIKDIVISEKSPDRIKIRIITRGTTAPHFDVIPIHREPARLAIDFKNTRSKRIKKTVNLLNLKQIRGAYNSPSVFRVVFDLKYLKKYKVSPKKGGKVLEVEFFNKNNDPQLTLSQNNINSTPSTPLPPPSSTPIDIEVKEKGLVLSNTTETPDTISVDDTAATPDNVGNKDGNENPGENGNGDQSNLVLSNIEDNDNGSGINDNNGVTVTQEDGPTTITNAPKTREDFFEDEKSRITGEEITATQSEKKGISVQSSSSGTGLIYERQTIEGGEKKYQGEPMTFNFHNADLKDVIKMIAKISGLNIILDPAVSGRVTSQLNQVPWDQALELFLKINGLDMVQEGNIIRIGRVEDLAAEARRRLELRNAKQLEGDLTVFTRTLSFAKASDVVSILTKQLSSRGGILQDARSNTLIISEIPDRIEILDKLIDTLDTPNPQVSIDARIVEANSNYIESFGIQWGYNLIADAAYGNQTTLKFPNSVSVSGNQFLSQASPLLGPLGGYAVNLPATGAMGGTVFSLGNVANTFRLDVAITAMQSKGQGRIISNPKTTTQNNTQASIMQGKLLPVQTIQNNTVTVQWRPAALEMKVTPQISADGSIILSLEIDNNEADFGNLVNGIPPIQTQSVKTTVRVIDGGTIVIGGMYRMEDFTTKDGIPFFSKIPLLGTLFRNRNKRGEQRELLVFITPRIIK